MLGYLATTCKITSAATQGVPSTRKCWNNQMAWPLCAPLFVQYLLWAAQQTRTTVHGGNSGRQQMASTLSLTAKALAMFLTWRQLWHLRYAGGSPAGDEGPMPPPAAP